MSSLLIAKHNSFPFRCRNASEFGKFSFRPCAGCGVRTWNNLLCRTRAHHENRDTTASLVRVGHAFVLVPPCDFDCPFEHFEFENSSDALNRYVTISDRWDVVASIWAIVQVESSGIILFPVIYQYSLDSWLQLSDTIDRIVYFFAVAPSFHYD